MIDPTNVPPVADQEILARYVLHSSHIRPTNRTIKPDAFVPHPYEDLSVTRHLLATEAQLWSVGDNIAATMGKTLYGRGDVRASVCLAQQLAVRAAPIANNPNHTNVSGWPAGKPAQKIIAQEIAASAVFVAR